MPDLQQAESFMDKVLETYRVADEDGGSTQVECQKCRGVAYVTETRDGVTAAVPCECVRMKRVVALARASGVPLVLLREMKLEGMTAPDVDYQGTLSRVKNWLVQYKKEQQDAGLLLYGRAGSGKTRVLIGSLRYLIVKKLIRCRYFDARSFLALVRSTYDSSNKLTETEAIQTFVEPEVVALDELTIPRTQWESEMTLMMIGERYKLRKTLLVATNLTPEQLADELDERIGSRLKAMCVSARLSPASGRDFRRDD